MGTTGQVLDHIARYIRAVATPVLGQDAGASEIALDTATATLKFGAPGATKEVADLSSTQTISGNKTFSGTSAFSGSVTFAAGTTGIRRTSVTAADTIAPAAIDSGTTYICTKNSATQVFTLPAAATAGLYYSFVCAGASGELQVGVATGDNIIGKTHGANDATGLVSTATTGLLKNTAASNVVGDSCTLQSDGITTWYMTAVSGVWSVT